MDKSPGAEMPLLAGLFILFISKEQREDERAVIIKASSAYMGLMLGYAIKGLGSNLYSHGIISIHLTDINHFLILGICVSNLYLLFKNVLHIEIV